MKHYLELSSLYLDYANDRYVIGTQMISDSVLILKLLKTKENLRDHIQYTHKSL